MKLNRTPHLKVLDGAVPIDSIAPSDLEAANALVQSGEAVVQTINDGRRSRSYLVPVSPPTRPSTTIQTEPSHLKTATPEDEE